jgi:hypothetical protein
MFTTPRLFACAAATLGLSTLASAQEEMLDMFGDESPEFSLRIFGDIGVKGDSKPNHGAADFGFGSLDFVISGTMGERLTFFSESLIEGEHSDEIFFD